MTLEQWALMLGRTVHVSGGGKRPTPVHDVADGGARHHAARRCQQHLLRSRPSAEAHLRMHARMRASGSQQNDTTLPLTLIFPRTALQLSAANMSEYRAVAQLDNLTTRIVITSQHRSYRAKATGCGNKETQGEDEALTVSTAARASPGLSLMARRPLPPRCCARNRLVDTRLPRPCGQALHLSTLLTEQ